MIKSVLPGIGVLGLCAFFSSPLPLLHAELKTANEGISMSLRVSEGGTAFAFSEQKGSFAIVNGRTKTPVTLKFIKEEEEPAGITLRYQIEELPSAAVLLRIETRPAGYFELSVVIDQQGTEQLWLEPLIDLEIPAGEFRWFDGFAEHKKANQRDQNVGTLPMAAAYTADKGWAIGLNPTDYVSHFRSEAGSEGDLNRLRYASRMVIDPKSKEMRRFVIFTFDPDFGYLNAVADYQRFFPERFQMTKGVRPQLAGPSSSGWRMKNDFYPHTKSSNYLPQFNEVFRWMGNGWNWCYAGFGYRPGDWLCTEELTGNWMVPLDKSNPEKKSPLRDFLKRSATEHLQLHLEAYDRLKALGEAPLMYIIPSYCEEELARDRFADSIYYDKDGKTRSSGPPWVVTFDHSLTMYPYGNSFGDYTLEAIKTIVERSNISGFAYDCIDRAKYLYTGPGTEKSPGRAYDEELGVYVNSEIANAIFGDKVHELKRGDEVMSLTGNFRGSSGGYLSAGAMDAAILEHSPWDDRPMPATARLLMGKKSISYLHGYARLPEAKKLDGERMLSMVQTLADYTVLKSLRYGIYPSTYSVIGSPQMVYYFRVFNDLYRHYGWEPTPAARADEKLWISRYGSGKGGVLFAGNATPKEISSALEASAKYFKSGSVAFVDYEGISPIISDIAGGSTRVDLKLGKGEVQLLAAALHWEKPISGKVRGERQRGIGMPIVDRFQFDAPAAGETMLSTVELPGHRVESVTVGGRPVELQREGRHVRFAANLAKGGGKVEIRHQPEIGISAAEALEKAEFLNAEGKPAFSIRIAADTPELRRIAERFGPYFTQIDSNAKAPEIEVSVGSGKDPEKAEGLTLYLGTSDELQFPTGEISAEGNTLLVQGRDAAALDATVSLMFDRIKERYPFYGYLMISDGALQVYASSFKPGLFQEKTGLTHLPWSRKQP